MQVNNSVYIKVLTGISLVAILFHISILLRIIPYEITWGGKLKTEVEMYVFETFSILINSFFIWVLSQKGSFIKPFFGKKTVSITLWIFFVILFSTHLEIYLQKQLLKKGLQL